MPSNKFHTKHCKITLVACGISISASLHEWKCFPKQSSYVITEKHAKSTNIVKNRVNPSGQHRFSYKSIWKYPDYIRHTYTNFRASISASKNRVQKRYQWKTCKNAVRRRFRGKNRVIHKVEITPNWSLRFWDPEAWHVLHSHLRALSLIEVLSRWFRAGST